MSVSGFPDWQNIAQWLGSPVEQQTGRVINAGSYTTPAFELSSWAAVIVAIKAIGGAVDVTVTQNVSGGPTSLGLAQTFHVSAGATLFEAVVLFGDSVTVKFQGAGAGTSIDYAIYPSNTTTNAQVITQATINVQHNDALVAAEPTIDFVDGTYFAWGVADDAANTRVKVTPPVPSWVPICDTVLGAAAAIIDTNTILGGNIPQTFRHLRFALTAQGDTAAVAMTMSGRINNDAAGNYDYAINRNANGAASSPATVGGTSFNLGAAPAAASGSFPNAWGAVIVDIPDYANTIGWKMFTWQSQDANLNQNDNGVGAWRATGAVTRLQVFPVPGNFRAGTRFTLYGLT